MSLGDRATYASAGPREVEEVNVVFEGRQLGAGDDVVTVMNVDKMERNEI